VDDNRIFCYSYVVIQNKVAVIDVKAGIGKRLCPASMPLCSRKACSKNLLELGSVADEVFGG
jgi:hypothetical protein